MRYFFILLGLGLVTVAATADVRLASAFGSHMVLQRDMKVPVWGTAAPSETVTVKFAGQKKICYDRRVFFH